jgi:hypothetical protein
VQTGKLEVEDMHVQEQNSFEQKSKKLVLSENSIISTIETPYHNWSNRNTNMTNHLH